MLNVADSDGDEGKIFAQLLANGSSQEGREAAIQKLREHDDHAELVINGEIVGIEQSYTGARFGTFLTLEIGRAHV